MSPHVFEALWVTVDTRLLIDLAFDSLDHCVVGTLDFKPLDHQTRCTFAPLECCRRTVRSSMPLERRVVGLFRPSVIWIITLLEHWAVLR